MSSTASAVEERCPDKTQREIARQPCHYHKAPPISHLGWDSRATQSTGIKGPRTPMIDRAATNICFPTWTNLIVGNILAVSSTFLSFFSPSTDRDNRLKFLLVGLRVAFLTAFRGGSNSTQKALSRLAPLRFYFLHNVFFFWPRQRQLPPAAGTMSESKDWNGAALSNSALATAPG